MTTATAQPVMPPMPTTATAPANPTAGTSSWVKITLVLTSFGVAVSILGLGVAGLLIAIYPADIGFGGQWAPFVIGMLAAFLLAAFVGGALLAASKKTNLWQGALIILILVLASIASTAIWAFNSGDWDWQQFWFGVAELALIVIAMGIVYIHTYLYLRSK